MPLHSSLGETRRNNEMKYMVPILRELSIKGKVLLAKTGVWLGNIKRNKSGGKKSDQRSRKPQFR